MLSDPDRRRLFLRHLTAWAVSDPYRNLLSAAGLVLGVAGIIVSLALVMGENRRFLERLRLVGVRSLYVTAVGGDLPWVSSDGLRLGLPQVERSSTVVATAQPVWTAQGRRVESAAVLGVDAGYFAIVDELPVRGRPIADVDVALANPVCVVGQGLYDRLGHPTTLYLPAVALEVVGVLQAPMGEGAETGLPVADPGGAVLIPATLGIVTQSGTGKSFLVVQARRERDVEALRSKLQRYLSRLSTAAVKVRTGEELLRRYRSARSHLSAVVAGFSILALLLGGLGILNNMLAVVLERLPEIGIRISMGATQRDIVVQFVAETLVVTVSGALAGAVLGLPTVGVVALLGLAPVVVPWWLPVLPPVLGVAIGVGCGALPAARAARYRPIETLTLR